LFPMLSGLFGISMLIDSLKNNAKIPKQRVTENLEVPKSKMSFRSLSAPSIRSAEITLPILISNFLKSSKGIVSIAKVF